MKVSKFPSFLVVGFLLIVLLTGAAWSQTAQPQSPANSKNLDHLGLQVQDQQPPAQPQAGQPNADQPKGEPPIADQPPT